MNENVFLRMMFHKIYDVPYADLEAQETDKRLWNNFIKLLKKELFE